MNQQMAGLAGRPDSENTMSRILVIDDQLQVRAAISVALKANNFDVVTVKNGRLALSELAVSRFDVVIVDIYMPEMDGLELISAMRAQRPDLPIIAISGALLRESGQSALEIAPADVVRLRKPFRPFELMKAIQLAMTPAASQTPASSAIL